MTSVEAILADLDSANPAATLPFSAHPAAARIIGIAADQYKSQWWGAEKLAAHQHHLLLALLKEARDNIPFYRDRLSSLVSLNSGVFDIDEFREIAPINRAEAQDVGTAIINPNPPAQHGPIMDFATSGSTGMPLSLKWTFFANAFAGAATIRHHVWHKSDPSAKNASLRLLHAAPPGSRVRTLRDNAWYLVFPCGEGVSQEASMPVGDQVDWLVREAPQYLRTYPSNAQALLIYANERNIQLPSLQRIDTYGESLPAGIRKMAREVWDVPIADKYSAREVGAIALQCPETDAYHIQSESVFVEVITDDGRPAQVGEQGRVVVTNLHNLGMPLIRYDIGDYAVMGSSCQCGRALPTLSGINGRVRNMLTLPDGNKIWPRFNSMNIHLAAPVRQYQLIQKSVDLIEIKLVLSREMSEDEESALRTMLREQLPDNFALPFKIVDSIPRSAGGKYEDFKSEI